VATESHPACLKKTSPALTSPHSQSDEWSDFPVALYVGGVRIAVERARMPQDEFGEFKYYPDPRITVDELLGHPSAWMTLFHELLHAVSEMYGLELDEGQIRTLEVALGDAFRANPKLRLFGEKI
jgi:hypothetical protein